jgi:hypothetical protein
LAGFARSLRATWPRALLRFLTSLAAVSLLWVVSGPVYAAGLGVIGRAFIPVLEGAPGTRYGVENGRLVAYGHSLPKQKRTACLFNRQGTEANYGAARLPDRRLAGTGGSAERARVGPGTARSSVACVPSYRRDATGAHPDSRRTHPASGILTDQAADLYWLYYFVELVGAVFSRCSSTPGLSRSAESGGGGTQALRSSDRTTCPRSGRAQALLPGAALPRSFRPFSARALFQ